jgi:hypothetical protein
MNIPIDDEVMDLRIGSFSLREMENMSRELHAEENRRNTERMTRASTWALERQPAGLREYNVIGNILKYIPVVYGPLLVDDQVARSQVEEEIKRTLWTASRDVEVSLPRYSRIQALIGTWNQAYYLDALMNHSLTEEDEFNIHSVYNGLLENINSGGEILRLQYIPIEDKIFSINQIANAYSRINVNDLTLCRRIALQMRRILPTFHLQMTQIVIDGLRAVRDYCIGLRKELTMLGIEFEAQNVDQATQVDLPIYDGW